MDVEVEFDGERDTLEIWIAPEAVPAASYHAGDFSVVVGEEGALVSVVIRGAEAFASQLAAQGLMGAVKRGAVGPGEKVWFEADSSMISAYAYDEGEQALEVAFNRTGVYRYLGVPRRVFEGLRRASSKGSYLGSVVIGYYGEVRK